MRSSEPFRALTLDELAAEPWRLDEVSLEALPRIYQVAATLAAAAAARIYARGSTSPDRLLNAEETAKRMGKSIAWMKDRGRTLPFAVKTGRSWTFSEQGLAKWIRFKERGK